MASTRLWMNADIIIDLSQKGRFFAFRYIFVGSIRFETTFDNSAGFAFYRILKSHNSMNELFVNVDDW